ncbi:S8 family serine peptidase [Lysobacter gummosus]|uniref:S8 family serine peptidase n=1 Tax=Lysobacter gummosus TaxID=262324 RepID=A0ABY3XJS1_9GAMM|nr:S8 family serine peptidase [Lysobacter gummosus]ALN91538.1 subtilase family protein [Lysobacter gummosus]UNP31901.1 S8 family serine peptidase [Lysobacter gummosus]
MSKFAGLKKSTLAMALAGSATLAAAAVGAIAMRDASPAWSAALGGTRLAAGGGSGAKSDQATPSPRTPYIVVYREEPLASYRGGVRGFAAPARLRSATGMSGGKLDVSSAAARSYVAHLQQAQRSHETRISSVVGRSLRVRQRLQHALNASIVDLSPAEAARVRKLPDVALVEPNRLYDLATDVGPALIGASVLWDALPGGFKGEGVVFNILDTGINFGSPSFAATDQKGYTHANPLGSGHYLGSCAPGGVDEGRCNDKLIGGYDFVCGPPVNACTGTTLREEPGFGDNDSHGSHTSSTAAGNFRTALFKGNEVRISGVAPHANIIMSDVCYYDVAGGRGSCPSTAMVSAVDQAVADGIVDVISFSISGGKDPWNESVSLAFLNANDAGIFVAAAAGNDGSGVGTVHHQEPWTASVAASTHTRGNYGLLLKIAGPAPVPEALSSALLTESSAGPRLNATLPNTTPVVLSPTWGTPNDGCAPFPANAFQGAIAVISRNSVNCTYSVRAQNAANAGARVALVVNYADSSFGTSGSASIPLLVTTQAIGDALNAFHAAHPGQVSGGIPYPPVPLPVTPDVLAGFSGRGPAGTFDLVKPDIAAPGVNILAAISGTAITGSENAVGLLSGTSMATPHLAGTAGLVRQMRPDWTPAEVKSALMMTAERKVWKEDGTTPADAFSMGAGRVQVDRAVRAGLVLDETKTGYLAANPAIGGKVSALNLPSLGDGDCYRSCTFERSFRNPTDATVMYRVKLEGLRGYTSAPVLRVPAGASRTLAVTIDSGNLRGDGSWHFGSVELVPIGMGGKASPALHLPVAVSVLPPSIAVTPQEIAVSLQAGSAGYASFSVGNDGGSPLRYLLDNTGVATRTHIDQRVEGGFGWESSIFSDRPGAAYLAADDFTLTEPTQIAKLYTPGFMASGKLASAASALTWSIYPDLNGNPAGDPETAPHAAAWTFSATPTAPGVTIGSPNQSVSLDLAAAGQNPTLPAGHYWLVVNATTSFANRWLWMLSTVDGDGSFRLRRAAPWGVRNDEPGMAYTMQVRNTCGTPWLGAVVDGATGSIQPGAGRNLRIRVDAAGLSPGQHIGYVCVASNDPLEPKVAARVRLTVTP